MSFDEKLEVDHYSKMKNVLLLDVINVLAIEAPMASCLPILAVC